MGFRNLQKKLEKGRYWDYESIIWMRYLLQVCCPRKPIYTPQKFNENGEHYFACDKQDPQPCPTGTNCVLGKQCGVKGTYRISPSPPRFSLCVSTALNLGLKEIQNLHQLKSQIFLLRKNYCAMFIS